MPNYVKGKLIITGDDSEKVIASLCTLDNNGNMKFDFNTIVRMPDSLNIVCGKLTDDCMELFINSLEDGTDAKKKYLSAYRSYGNAIYEPSMSSEVQQEKFAYLLERYAKKSFDDEPIFYSKADILAYGKRALDNIIEYGYRDWYDWRCNNWGTKWNACDSTVFNNGIEFCTAWSHVALLIIKASIMHPFCTFDYQYADEDFGQQTGRLIVQGGEIIDYTVNEDGSKEAYEQAFQLWGGAPDYLVYNPKKGTYEYKE